MTRTAWAVTVALLIAAGSLALAGTRRYVLGDDIDGPRGRSAWKIGLVAVGRFDERDGSLTVRFPPDFRRQHLVDTESHAIGVVPRNTRGSQTESVWEPEALGPGKPQRFRLSYSFRCILGLRRPTPAMTRGTRRLDAAPAAGDYLVPSARIQSDAEPIRRKAQELVGKEATADADLVRRLYEYVRDLPDDPALEPLSAVDCLEQGGDSADKSRLLVALCRNRGVPARLLSGLILRADRDHTLHHWAEVWVGHWLAVDAAAGHFGDGQFPTNYLVLHIGDEDVVQARGGSVSWGFTARQLSLSSTDEPPSPAKAFWMRLSLFHLRPAEQQLVKFLLLLPLAALLVTFIRTVIGVPTFGTFAPALLGLAFLDLRALPWGMGIFLAIVLVGWLLRRLLQDFHLLQVPRIAVLLTLIVMLLVGGILLASHAGVATTRYLSLFPLIILTHLVERFWTLEAEDGTRTAFTTLMYTLGVSVVVSVILSPTAVAHWMLRYPETLGLVLAALFLLGRYTGYRLTELYRFADLITEEERIAPAPVGPAVNKPAEVGTPGGSR
jgi:transglutaminase-like putative cysteine protease